jgi:hypothetical protein
MIGGALLGAAVLSASHVTPAVAADAFPCGPQRWVDWSADLVQECPLTSPLAPNNWVPVYANPIPNPRGHQPPPPAGWLHGVAGQSFICEQEFTGAVFYHPRGWRNYWWAYTLSDDEVKGWVPEVFFRGGDDDEPDAGLRECAGVGVPGPAPPGPAVNPCEPSPVDPGMRVRASFGRAGRTVITRYGSRRRVHGIIAGADGAPLAGVTLCVGAIDPAAGALRQAASVVTDAQGRFAYTLPLGPSRRVWFVHRAGAGAAVASVFVRVRAPIRLRASRRTLHNGQSVVLRGRLGGQAQSGGLIVEMQARRGISWQTFAATRSRKSGRFSYRYTFTRTLGVQRYDLRARVLAQRGYPFATGASRPVRLTVRG